MGLTISLIAFLMALGALPWRSPYRLETMFPEQVGEGGFLGRVRFFGKRGRNLLSPALTYRRELEKALREQLSIDEGAGEQAILAALGTRGLAAGAIAEARTLLRELAALQEGSDGPTPPRVTSGRLRRLIGRGERLLQLIAPPGDATR